MAKFYPFASGSEYTASYAVSSSYAGTVDRVRSVQTASLAGTVINRATGSDAAIDICVMSYEEYLLLLSGSHYEVC